MFYTVPKATPLQQLMNDALTLAHMTGHDVFNALDIFENGKILKGRLHCRLWGGLRVVDTAVNCCFLQLCRAEVWHWRWQAAILPLQLAGCYRNPSQ
jgi:hypothetical protein